MSNGVADLELMFHQNARDRTLLAIEELLKWVRVVVERPRDAQPVG